MTLPLTMTETSKRLSSLPNLMQNLCGHCLVTLSLTMTETSKRLSSLPNLMQTHSGGDSVASGIVSLSSHILGSRLPSTSPETTQREASLASKRERVFEQNPWPTPWTYIYIYPSVDYSAYSLGRREKITSVTLFSFCLMRIWTWAHLLFFMCRCSSFER